MKYENFKEAKSLVEQIDKTQDTLDELESSSTTTLVINTVAFSILTIPAYNSETHECSPLAIEFIEKLKVFHKSKLNRLLLKLEKL